MKEYSYRVRWNEKLIREGKKVHLCNGATTKKFVTVTYKNGHIIKEKGWSVYDCRGIKIRVVNTHKDAKICAEDLIDFTKCKACMIYDGRYIEENL